MSATKIIIIGAGIGGLTLAQVLRKAHIDFEIFERDESAGSREQGWGLGLSWVLAPMRESLTHMSSDVASIALPTFDVNVEPTRENKGFMIADGENGNKLVKIEFGGLVVSVNRAKFRTWLQEGISVNWNKRYKSHVCENGGVAVTFEDGSVVHGSALVGGDGVHSRVRSVLFAEKPQTPELVPVSLIVGISRIPRAQYTKLAKLVDPGYNVIVVHDLKRVFTVLREVSEDRETAEYVWFASKQVDDPQKILNLSKSELFEAVKSDTELFPDSVKLLVQNGANENQVQAWPARILVLDDIPNGVVTLLGDAAHAMTPFRGEGGQVSR